MRNVIYYLSIAVGLIYLSQFVNITFQIIFEYGLNINNFFVDILGMIVSMLLPYLIYKRFSLDIFNVNNLILLIPLFLAFYRFQSGLSTGQSILYVAIIAVSEEGFYRCIIQNCLEKGMPIIWAIIFQSLLFALLNHSAYSVFENIVYRFPAGLVLSLLAKKFGLSASISLHFINNILQA